ncbi:MAG: hypothetical protein Q8P04_01005 [bacterium]|nr:hypothetical protein [bacterium]
MRARTTFFFISFLLVAAVAWLNPALAAGISVTNRWAWNDVAGWIDLQGAPGGPDVDVNVVENKLKNYGVFYNDADEYFSLDCQTTPNGNICSGPSGNWFVSNDTYGDLAGWAWTETYGWVSFCGNSSGGSTYNGTTWVCPSSPTYQVIIRPNPGGSGSEKSEFSGWAWNDIIGWISFNCNNSGIGNTCPPGGASDYKVRTAWESLPAPVTGWLESSTYDTGILGGAAFNGIMWQGTPGSGGTTLVKFQVATANCSNGATDSPTCTTSIGWGGSKTSGDGAFVGSDGTSAAYYQPGGPGVPAAISTIYHNNKRYFRYRVFLERDAAATTPVVQDVIINWSP